MANSRTPELSVGIGRRIAELRDVANVTAETIAVEAKVVGLRWERITVTFVETGRRGISAEELLMLPIVMTRALGRDVSLRELLPKQAKVPRGMSLSANMFDRILTGKPVRSKLQPSPPPRRNAAVG